MLTVRLLTQLVFVELHLLPDWLIKGLLARLELLLVDFRSAHIAGIASPTVLTLRLRQWLLFANFLRLAQVARASCLHGCLSVALSLLVLVRHQHVYQFVPFPLGRGMLLFEGFVDF